MPSYEQNYMRGFRTAISGALLGQEEPTAFLMGYGHGSLCLANAEVKAAQGHMTLVKSKDEELMDEDTLHGEGVR